MEGATWGPRGRGCAQGAGRTLYSRGQMVGPPSVFSVPDILKYSTKNHTKFQGIWRTFIFGIFLYCTDNQKEDINYYFCLVCDSSVGPISFCSGALFIANFCCIGDPVLELACQIYVVKSSSNA